MKLICGIGNTGKLYHNTRHNVGFMVLDLFKEQYNLSFSLNKKFNCEVAEGNIDSEKVFLVKTLSFVNNTGVELSKIINYYKIPISDILIISDDINLDIAKLRYRPEGSSGGHKGLNSIIAQLGTNNFSRLRIGIGNNPNIPRADFVLSGFNVDESQSMHKSFEVACQVINYFIRNQNINDLMSTL
jgi:PTH1 family peptidyl-tRNA hydrolase